jgi:hypothetical protein
MIGRKSGLRSGAAPSKAKIGVGRISAALGRSGVTATAIASIAATASTTNVLPPSAVSPLSQPAELKFGTIANYSGRPVVPWS